MIGTAIHEIAHFIFFIKWQQVFPHTRKREYNSPYLSWHLSEMVQAIVLNDKRLKKITGRTFRTYPEYEKAEYKGKPLLTYLQSFYDNRKDFADFLRKSYSFLKRIKKKYNLSKTHFS